ncbi:response regulator transcription factor [Crocinitomix algicola]|uniref:response regulator transcription factor n=1 Tax=Crocinitomix algicola TaxID=1740263 RepID=UPI00082DFF68|nr:response regulator transcription factor [Crocinitomix algicola]
MVNILLVEDEEQLASLIVKGLAEEGYNVIHAQDGLKGLSYIQSNNVDLVLLDILLPGMNGLEVCKNIRLKGFIHIPVIMLTALNSAENVVLGLDNGADDYIPKPFKLIELKARIRTLLRRTNYQTHAAKMQDEIFSFEDLVLNDSQKSVERNGIKLNLTSTEYKLLAKFMANQGKVLSRTTILEDVWGIDFDIGTNVVDVYVNYLRKKMEFDNLPRLIQTVIGMGYVLKNQD